MLVLLLGAAPVRAQGPLHHKDRKPPTTPTNLRVTAKTSYSVSLAWDPATDNSGRLDYAIVNLSTNTMTQIGQASTSFTWTYQLTAGQSYSFYVYAVDAAGNRSKNSNTATAALPPDTILPTKPVVAVGDVGPTHVSLSWSSTDDGPSISYQVYMNGSPVLSAGSQTSATITSLQPETAYTFTVQARDNGSNLSPLSDPVTVTTRATDYTDLTPPSSPPGIAIYMLDSVEAIVMWGQSTDDVTPKQFIYYDVYVNGVFEGSTNLEEMDLYLVFGILNTVSVVAVDGAGNRSAPTTTTFDLREP
jgi:chitodextrinase